MGNGNGKATSAWEWFERLSKVLTILVIPVLLWAIRVELFIRQGERYTPEAAQLDMVRLQQTIEDRVLPKSFQDKVLEMQSSMVDNTKHIRNVELSVARLEGKVAGIQADVSAIRTILDSD